MMKLSVAVITRDEEKNIRECLQSVHWADEIVVIDSCSRDRTVPIAKEYTPHVYEMPFRDFSFQKNEALNRMRGDWIFFLDADERVPPPLASELREAIQVPEPRAYAVKRLTTLFGRPMHFSGMQDDCPVRLFPRGRARFEQPVHERLVTDLPVVRLKHPLLHQSTRDLRHYFEKLNLYLPLELETMRQAGRKPERWRAIGMPFAKFFYLFGWKLGLLDGWAGLQYAALSAYYDFHKHWRYGHQA